MRKEEENCLYLQLIWLSKENPKACSKKRKKHLELLSDINKVTEWKISVQN